ncbi:DUF1097 domain-containing protein [Methylophaga pinxianii]|uniref:DUF1097 domain-containing protein n=1 Tax=Methylophaga pinxianii TaxID=2881052 RepID=UPI001CF109BB|nr:DUF1097 domain-containing protein [Methylophaga pinxianii]MCB2428064.1 DUF1097 domain-containing protein [Methylophaga pinxianii]UPH46061.1 DUF1097 domain-containing protein [Methylophaga pinxianii]
MTQLNAVTLSAFVLTTIVLYVLGFFTFIPPWAVFIAWACFFHMNGGINRNQAFMATIRHMALGATAAWISAIFLLNNPAESTLGQQLGGAIFIGAIIAILARMSTITLFNVTPAIIYGYASFFAFASTTGLFALEHLLSVSFNNALIAILFSSLIGVTAGYFNAIMVAVLVKQESTNSSKMESVVNE